MNLKLHPVTEESVQITNDIDSVLVVSNSLKAFHCESVIYVPLGRRNVVPDSNKKAYEILEKKFSSHFNVNDYCWKSFKFANDGVMKITFLMQISKATKTLNLRSSFLTRILREAGKKLQDTRTNFTNIDNFYEIDHKRQLAIYSEDWPILAENIDLLLQQSSFLGDFKIKKFFFYGKQ